MLGYPAATVGGTYGECAAVGNAAAVVANTPEAARRVRRAFPSSATNRRLDHQRVRRHDFEVARPERRRQVPHRPHRISTHRRRAAAPGLAPPPRRSRRRSRSSRAPTSICRAVDRLIGRDPGLASRSSCIWRRAPEQRSRGGRPIPGRARARVPVAPHDDRADPRADMLFLPCKTFPPSSARASFRARPTSTSLPNGRSWRPCPRGRARFPGQGGNGPHLRAGRRRRNGRPNRGSAQRRRSAPGACSGRVSVEFRTAFAHGRTGLDPGRGHRSVRAHGGTGVGLRRRLTGI